MMCAAKCQNREIDRWRDRAHRRYLSALRSLASVRKLISVHIDVQGAFGEQDPLEARRRGTVAV
jgi:hypothetical protein